MNYCRIEGGSNTALHLCAFHDKPECMKLLLRSGADFTGKNGQDRTPLEIAQERGHKTCEDLVSCVYISVIYGFYCSGDYRIEWSCPGYFSVERVAFKKLFFKIEKIALSLNISLWISTSVVAIFEIG